MAFQKGHHLGFLPEGNTSLDRNPLSIKLPKGLREEVMQIQGWQDELRELIKVWVESKEKSGDV